VQARQLAFGACPLALLVLLSMSLREIRISGYALNIESDDMQDCEERREAAGGPQSTNNADKGR
jgi:hypothetical protein